MATARFRFYAELNDFLLPEMRGRDLNRRFDASGSVKDFIESFGVPHTEVDLVLVNGEPVGFSYKLRNGDAVSVYPVFESFDIASISRVRAAPLRELRFTLDVHLGRLAAYLRMAGFDAEYANNASDPALARAAQLTGRVLLTRDRYMLMRSNLYRGYWVRSANPKEQFAEVLRRFQLADSMRPFTRCMPCNGELRLVQLDAVRETVPERARSQPEFRQCSKCGRVYWEGTHHARMTRLLEWATNRLKLLDQ